MKTTIESSGRMHNPAHPGEILKEMYMGPLGVTITQAADALGVSRKHVSAIVNGRAPVSPDMAARLAGVFGTEPDIWKSRASSARSEPFVTGCSAAAKMELALKRS
jgi:addiction module HigA family antidote